MRVVTHAAAVRPVMPFGRGRRARWIPILSIAVPGLGWLLFGAYPTLATFFYSLTKYSGEPGTALNFTGLSNYVSAFTTNWPELLSSMRVTLEYTVGVVILQNLAGVGLALLLNTARRGTGFYRALVFMPQVFSVVVVGVMFSLIFDPISGPVEPLYHALFGGESSFFGSANLALPLVIFVTAWESTGWSMVIYLAGLRNIPSEIYEAAAVDGVSRTARFRRITWPLLAPATTVSVLLAAITCIGQYSLILVITNGFFGTETLGMYMYEYAFGSSMMGSTSSLGYGSMIAVFQLVVTLVVALGLMVWLRRREVQL
jgi:raffinose/stachyose/melibiose transport system permease protein